MAKHLSSLQDECGLRNVVLEAVLDDGPSIHLAMVAGPGKLLHVVITGSDKPAPPIALRLASFLHHSVEGTFHGCLPVLARGVTGRDSSTRRRSTWFTLRRITR